MGMILLLFCSVFAASANTLLFKVTLNAFSSPTTNCKTKLPCNHNVVRFSIQMDSLYLSSQLFYTLPKLWSFRQFYIFAILLV
jgi:hypothetical protein